ncbi:aspartate/glutamate racemase family protein [Marinobacterium arenosum]|uniref:aspartate/glutamate racemase family protein n=1 Tax=Marinobacterium arenosum TaxID=2862496 RepID=UPI001C974093|nr:amino acid racemase [Marinobacterium arenosum]MBY4677095.1 amino acid racemase [Marinobacterium arenosum]
MAEKIVGIIGGMGPEATVDLMNRVIAATPAADDADHLRMIVDNNPKVPSRIKALIEKTGESPGPCMAEMGRRLQRYGADFLVIPCNTAHHYYQDVVDAVSIPVLNMVELTVDRVCAEIPHIRRAGVLASTAVLMVGLYHRFFAVRDVKTLFPQPYAQDELMALIRKVKAGRHDAAALAAFKLAAENLKAQGAECLIIACTELSVVAAELKIGLPVYDASQLLAEEIVHVGLASQPACL